MLVKNILPAIRQRMLCIAPDATLLQAARLLDGGDDMVLVCDRAGRLEGVVTKSDVVRMIGRCTGASCTAGITAAMTRDVVTATPNVLLHDMWRLMRDRGLKNAPVLDGTGVALGILNARDALQALFQELRYEEELMRDYVTSFGYH